MKNNTDTFTHYTRLTTHGITNEKTISSSTRLVLEEAQNLGIEITRLNGTKVFELKYQDQLRHLYFQNPGNTTCVGMFIANSKRSTRNILTANNISVPKGYTIKFDDTDEYKKEVFDKLKKPLIVKPDKGTQGKGISVEVNTLFEYITAMRKAFNYSKSKKGWIIVEQQLQGFEEYRVLVSRNKLIGAIKRIPANITGDGVSNIRKLIKEKNKDPRRGDFEDHPPLFKIIMDDDMKEYLQRQGFTWKHVPKKGEVIYLRGVSNISMGGDSIDFTEKIHPSVKEIALKAINTIPGFKIGGVDFMSKDITVKQTPDSYAIIEINDSPGLDIHDYPFKGINRKAGVEFLKVLFGVEEFGGFIN